MVSEFKIWFELFDSGAWKMIIVFALLKGHTSRFSSLTMNSFWQSPKKRRTRHSHNGLCLEFRTSLPMCR